MSASTLLEKVDREQILRNAHRFYRNIPEHKAWALWSFVSDVTGYGSSFSRTLCVELGWDPHAEVSENLPPRRSTVETSANTACVQANGCDTPNFCRGVLRCTYKDATAVNTKTEYECNNDKCNWKGPVDDTVHPKHMTDTLLCPECYETVERR